jgi:hypothetical protein
LPATIFVCSHLHIKSIASATKQRFGGGGGYPLITASHNASPAAAPYCLNTAAALSSSPSGVRAAQVFTVSSVLGSAEVERCQATTSLTSVVFRRAPAGCPSGRT